MIRDLERAVAAGSDPHAAERLTAARERLGQTRLRIWFIGSAKRGRLTHMAAPEKGGPPPRALCGQALDPQNVGPDLWYMIDCRRCKARSFADWERAWAPHAEVFYQTGLQSWRWGDSS